MKPSMHVVRLFASSLLIVAVAVSNASANDELPPDVQRAVDTLIRSVESLQRDAVSQQAGRDWLESEIRQTRAKLASADESTAESRQKDQSRLDALLAAREVLDSLSQPVADAESKVSFARDIAPILIQNCLICHGPKKRSSGYRLDTFENLMQPGDSTVPPIRPGRPDESELHVLIVEEDVEYRMPKDADPLPNDQIARIRRWIEQGAMFDGRDAKAALSAIVPAATYPDPPKTYPVPVPITALAFHPQGNELAVGGYHEVTLWNPANGALLRRLSNVPERVYGLAYSPDGTRLAVAGGAPGRSGDLRVFDLAKGELLAVLGSSPDVLLGAAYRPDGQRLAACGADQAVRIFDPSTGQLERQIDNHADWVMAVAWSANGTRLATASRDRTAKLYDAATGDVITTYADHDAPVMAVAFLGEGDRLVSAGAGDRRPHIWSAGPQDGDAQPQARSIAKLDAFAGDVFDLVAVGQRVWAASADKQVREFDAGERKTTRAYAGHADWVYRVAVHAETKRVAAGAYDGRVRVWDTASGEPIATFTAVPGHESSEATE